MQMDIVIFDSEKIAGDNGEYAYRKIWACHPDIHLTFLISKHCPDFQRLKNDGFNVHPIEDGIDNIFKKADYILFSKNLGFSYRTKWLQRIYRNKTIFLGHGVTSKVYDDSFYLKGTIGSWAKYILVTSEDEKNIIVKYSSKRLVPLLLGFPRHDTLFEKSIASREKKRPK